MATIHKCDRCDTLIDNYFTYNNTIILPMYLYLGEEQKNVKSKPTQVVDVCNQCMLWLRKEFGLEGVDRIDE